MAFASGDRLFVGTTAGEVFRADQSGNSWQLTRIEQRGNWPSDFARVDFRYRNRLGRCNQEFRFTSRTVARETIGTYGTLTAQPGSRGVGLREAAQTSSMSSTTPSSSILRIRQTSRLGPTSGLAFCGQGPKLGPRCPMAFPRRQFFDLQVHPTKRLLRASTHGRGLYEFAL